MTDVEVSVKLKDIEDRSKSNTYRIADVEKRQDNLDKLVTSVAVMATEQEHIKDDVTEIKGDVKTLAGKPGKRWDNLIEKIVWAVAAGLVAFMLARFGLV